MRRHFNLVENYKYKCRFCDQEFFNSSQRKTHEEKMHEKLVDKNEKREFKCQFCDKIFTNMQNLQYHRNSVHIKGEFRCKDCEKVFKTKTKLQLHWKYNHKPKQPCDICGIMTQQMGNHKRDHHSHVVCEVEGCGREFKSKHLYSTHKKLEHTKLDESIACEYCGKIFVNELKMKRHINQVRKKIKNMFILYPMILFKKANRIMFKKNN